MAGGYAFRACSRSLAAIAYRGQPIALVAPTRSKRRSRLPALVEAT